MLMSRVGRRFTPALAAGLLLACGGENRASAPREESRSPETPRAVSSPEPATGARPAPETKQALVLSLARFPVQQP